MLLFTRVLSIRRYCFFFSTNLLYAIYELSELATIEIELAVGWNNTLQSPTSYLSDP